VSAILVSFRGFGVTAVEDVSSKKTNFGSHFEILISKGLNSCVVSPLKRLFEANDRVISSGDASDFPLFRVGAIYIG